MNPETDKRPLVFREQQADQPDEQLSVPCGRCSGCRADKRRAWGVRCYHEAQMHERNTFLTLTYDEDHVVDEIYKAELQLFFKRLRKQVGPFRYFACGEYGDRTHRAHYHALIFGKDFRGNEKRRTLRNDYESPIINKTWTKGLHECGDITGASAFYVAGYEQKKLDDEDTFTLMSRNIGKTFVDNHFDDIRRAGACIIEGKEHPVPRRYFDWQPEELQSIKDDYTNYARGQDKWHAAQQRGVKEKLLYEQKINQAQGSI